MTKRKQASRISVADYLSQQIALSGKSQKEIAEELSYEKPNIITMFKQGKTKVPLNKVSQFAKALGVDPVHFLRIVLLEYSPETWEVLEQILGRSMISESEMSLLAIIRDASQGRDVSPSDEEDKLELMTLVAKWRDRQEQLVKAAEHRKIVK